MIYFTSPLLIIFALYLFIFCLLSHSIHIFSSIYLLSFITFYTYILIHLSSVFYHFQLCTVLYLLFISILRYQTVLIMYIIIIVTVVIIRILLFFIVIIIITHHQQQQHHNLKFITVIDFQWIILQFVRPFINFFTVTTIMITIIIMLMVTMFWIYCIITSSSIVCCWLSIEGFVKCLICIDTYS